MAIGINQLIDMWLNELPRLEILFECLQKEYICDVKNIVPFILYFSYFY